MTLDMDKIQFESRNEIAEIMDALETYTKEHPRERSAETVKELTNLLDAMYMSW